MTLSSLRKRLMSYHQSVETSNAATQSCNMFAWQIDLCLLIIVLDWTEQLNLCAKTYSLANVSRIFSHFLQGMAITRRVCFGNWERINGPISLTSTRSGERIRRDGGTIGLTSTSWSGVRIGRSGRPISLTSTSWSGERIERSDGPIRLPSTTWSGGSICLRSTSWSGERIRRSGGTISLTSTSRSGVRIRKNDDMTYKNFLPGQQKKQHITLSMEQMRMVRIFSSLKYLVPMT